MADFTSKLQQLSVRGTPVGAEELIERIEAELAGDPLVVVTKRREGVFMTKTDESAKTQTPGPGRGLAWAVAAFVVVLAVGGLLYVALSGGGSDVADTTPDTEAMTDLEIIEAGVAALYSGDADRAVELFEVDPQDGRSGDDWIRETAAYQAAVEGRLTLDCTERDTPGLFTCTVPYHNVFTDAIGYVDSPGETIRVAVDEGVITEFNPYPLFIENALKDFLQDQGALLEQGEQDQIDSLCNFEFGATTLGWLTLNCADFVRDHLDEWADWAESAFLGVGSDDVTTGRAGAAITEVYSEAAAEAAGLKVGDIVISVDGVPVGTRDELVAQVRSHSPGSTIDVVILREGVESTIEVTLGTRSDDFG